MSVLYRLSLLYFVSVIAFVQLTAQTGIPRTLNVQGVLTSSFGSTPLKGEQVFRIGMATNFDGAHAHNVSIGTASPNSIDNRPVSKKMYAFVYLGE